MTLTDVPPVLPLLRLNVERNAAPIAAAGGHATVVSLEWMAEVGLAATDEDACRPCVPPVASSAAYDVVLGADLVYNSLSDDGTSSAQLMALAAVLRRLLADGTGGAREPLLLLAHKRRHAELDSALIEELRAVGVALEELPFDALHPQYRSPTIALFAEDLAVTRPVTMTVWSGRLIFKSDESESTIEVFHRPRPEMRP